MRRPSTWLLLLVLLLAGCAGNPAREAAPSHVTKREAGFVALAPPESLPEGDDLLLDVGDVGGGLCVSGVGTEGWAFLIDACHSQGGHCAAAAGALILGNELALVELSHNDSDHLSNLPEIAATRKVDPALWASRVPLKSRYALDAPCPTTSREFVARFGELAADDTTAISLANSQLAPGSSYVFGDIEVGILLPPVSVGAGVD